MFHSAKDGKGPRHTYVNGNRIECVQWANEEQGLVCFRPGPRRGKLSNKERRKGEMHSRILRGNVRVEFIHETTQTAKQTPSDDTEGTETT
jgi:hypothetical protein